MILQQILLHIFYKLNNERTINAAYHLLRGKRSGQTIQDVGIFKLYPHFGLLRKLSRQTFEQEVQTLRDNDYITVDENGYFTLTAAGEEQVSQLQLPYFDGWHYRGNEHIFFARLSLVVQSLSNQSAGIHAFIPVQREEQIQAWCRQFLRDTKYQSNAIQQSLYEEIISSLEQSAMPTLQKELLMNRLTGVGVIGIPWQQLSFEYQMPELDCQLQFVSGLHRWLDAINHDGTRWSYLSKLAEQIRMENVLTGSAYQTAQLYHQGYAVEQICEMRRLKPSTIEDHLVELAINEPTFDITPFVTMEEQRQVHSAVEDYATRKLKVLHTVLPHLTYFQIRLVLAKGEV
ncbi:helix-turn-helix domain-containing protein [Lysinibacillus sp. KU-BSD001]|uniref:helix-turn-helix domain-containing protein n=1 Tax=Lysinibacillus sp. KU-BSD001 TaxID=3141328 RepID=UPI0036E809E4